MQLQLPPALESFVQEEVESGRYRDASEVVSEALRLLNRSFPEPPWPSEDYVTDTGEKLVRLRSAVEKGRASASRGDVVVLKDDAAVDAYFDALDAR